MNRHGHKTPGFTLIELLVATAIFVAVIAGILMGYLRSLELNEISRNTMIATQAVTNRMEQIKATPFNQIKANFHNVSFAVNGINGMGVSYVNDSDPELLQINISVSWRQPGGRIFGEDKNLNGQIDAGEDANGNGMLDSPVQVSNALFQQ